MNYPFASTYTGSLTYKHPKVLRNKNTVFKAFLHYSESNVEERTVFGERNDGLFYNYDDRLYGWNHERWSKGLKLAGEQVEKNTARYFEIALNYFHEVEDVNLRHVLLGLNRGNGYHYLVFGYTYTPKQTTGDSQ